MRRFLSIGAFIGILTTTAFADAPARVALQLKVEPQSAIDRLNPAAKVRFYLQSWPIETDSMFILDANDDVIAVARNKSTDTIGFIYGSGTHRVNAEVYDAKGNLLGSTTESVPFTVESKLGTLDNGIAVGFGKQFDDRSLAAMLRDVEAGLAANQGSAFKGLGDAVGRFQGQTSDRSFFGVSATTTPTPGVENTSTIKTADTGATGSTEVKTEPGDKTTTTTKTGLPSQDVENTQTRKTTQAATTALTVSPPPPSNVTFTQTSLGIGAEDLLGEQANLAAQYINLRLLLQRSLSDRVVMRANGTSQLRAQPVYGFQISVDPSPKYRDAVAEAIVTVSHPVGDQSGREAPRLVTLLPKEKTYNVAEVMSRSRAFSLGAVVGVANAGVAFNQSRETLYVVKDTDTIAVEKVLPGSAARTSTAFAWQFRPVLGKRVVAPGTRQVFAVLALPTSIDEPWQGIVTVTTQWRRFNRKTKTVGDVIPDSISSQEPYLISVSRLQEQEVAVAATIEKIDLRAVGPTAAIVTVEGQFPQGTLVSAADSIIDSAASGMLVKTGRRLSFMVAPERLFYTPTLIDTFGVATPLRVPGEADPQPFEIIAAGQEQERKFAVYLRLLRASAFNALDAYTTPKSLRDAMRSQGEKSAALHQPLVLIGHSVFGLSDAPIEQISGAACDRSKNHALCDEVALASRAGGVVKLVFDAPPAVLQDARVVRVVDLFHGTGEFVEHKITFANPEKAITIGELQFVDFNNASAQLALSGQLLQKADRLQLRVGGKPCTRSDVTSDSMIIFACETAALATATRAVVTYGDGESKLLAIPPLPSLRVQVLRQEAIREGEVRALRLEGNDLSAVAAARYNGTQLRISHDSGSNDTIYVDVAPTMTSSAGDKLLQLILSDGRILQTIVTVDGKTKG